MGKSRSKGPVAACNRAQFIPPPLRLQEASVTDLQEQIRSISRAESQAAAARSRVAAEYSRRLGQKAAEKTVREQSGKSNGGSRAEVEVARKLQDLPGTKKAFEDGQITYGHARIIVNTAGRSEIDETELVGRAKEQPVDVFAKTAKEHEQQRSRDDGMSWLERQKTNRKAWIKTDPGDGMTVLYGQFDPITGARIKSVLSAKTNELWREEDPKHRPSTAQRMADAVAELLCEPAKGKSKSRGATLFLVAHYDFDGQTIRNATLADGTPVPVAVFRDMACQGRVVPAIFDTRNQPLWVGMGKRTATPAQRMALMARDQACVGCGADPAWCQAHHIVHWAADGPTDIDNMVLLCSRCHHQVHDDKWRVEQSPDGKHTLRPPPTKRRSSRTRKRPPPSAGKPNSRRPAKPKTNLLL